MDRARIVPQYARGDGYHALGLRYNPFIAEQRPGVAETHWLTRADEPAAPLAGQRTLTQLLGPRGAGKTSLLLRWRAQHPGPYYYVAPGWPRWRIPPFASLVYWDELDRMAAPVRALALRLAAARSISIVAGSHCDLSGAAQRAGLAVATHEFAPLTVALLQQWAALRIQTAQQPGITALLQLDPSTAQAIVDQAGASWREAGVLLHIWAAQQAAAALGRANQTVYIQK